MINVSVWHKCLLQCAMVTPVFLWLWQRGWRSSWTLWCAPLSTAQQVRCLNCFAFLMSNVCKLQVLKMCVHHIPSLRSPLKVHFIQQLCCLKYTKNLFAFFLSNVYLFYSDSGEAGGGVLTCKVHFFKISFTLIWIDYKLLVLFLVAAYFSQKFCAGTCSCSSA